MKIINNGLIKFDYQFPLYNFFFPSQASNVFEPSEENLVEIFKVANQHARSRALYFHVPFFEAICTFCPFTRGLYKDEQDINRYTQALIREIEYKAQLVDLKAVPVRAIFFGGGTPSLLSPDNIRAIGQALHHYFDMRAVEEFSFEFNITSVTSARVQALAEIGVTHARFGLQTMDPRWRKMFNLDPDISKVERAANLLCSHFDHVLCDIMYGMNGSSERQTLTEIDKAIELGLSNIDVYPINNAATSVKLHKKIKDCFPDVMPAIRKLNMKFMIDAHLRQHGYQPYNGHGYVKQTGNSSRLITGDYSFIYHEHIYGYSDHDVLGFGVGAISSVAGNVITNTSAREKYIRTMTGGQCVCHVSQHDPVLDTVKPLVMRLPYHGSVDKRLIEMDRVPKGLIDRLSALIEADLIYEQEEEYRLTHLGWLWYSNIMFYLMPESEQDILKKLVFERLDTPGRDITQDELIYTAG